MSRPTLARTGILLVDKPMGMTSADVLNKIKRQHQFTKIGHGGTLDPFATGLLVVLLGEATKIARFLLEGNKEYIANAKLGEETETGDHTGAIVQKHTPPILDKEQWQSFAQKFLGTSKQTPPMYSAIKVNGRPLYEYARKGEVLDIPSRDIEIHAFEVLESTAHNIRFRVACSGGTYIRVLASDLAKAAGTVAHLDFLRRTKSSQFSIDDSLTLADVLAANPAELKLVPIEHALQHLPRVTCRPDQALRVRQGNLAVFQELREQLKKPGYFLVFEDGKESLLAIANHHPMLRPFCSLERVFESL